MRSVKNEPVLGDDMCLLLVPVVLLHTAVDLGTVVEVGRTERLPYICFKPFK